MLVTSKEICTENKKAIFKEEIGFHSFKKKQQNNCKFRKEFSENLLWFKMIFHHPKNQLAISDDKK